MIKRLLILLVYIILNICIACDYSYVIDRPHTHDIPYYISIDSTDLDTIVNDAIFDKQIDNIANDTDSTNITDSIPIIFIVDVEEWKDSDN